MASKYQSWYSNKVLILYPVISTIPSIKHLRKLGFCSVQEKCPVEKWEQESRTEVYIITALV